MKDLQLTVVGNLTDQPELRYTPKGAPVANFTVAHTPRVRDGNEWKDGETTFMRCTAWRQLAENLATLERGTRVIVVGTLGTRSWQDREGNKRSSMELTVEEGGPSVAMATATVHKAQRSRQQQGGWGGQQQQSQGGWGSGRPSEPAKEGRVMDPPQGGWDSHDYGEPPF